MRWCKNGVLLLSSLLCYESLPGVMGDLRFASQPVSRFAVTSWNNVPFVPTSILYMEPSDFNYANLKTQRDGGAYDQFLRSNIDNEQAKRNFVTEVGRDHLPFRSFEGAVNTNDGDTTVRNKIPIGSPGPALYAVPGVPYILPHRWNNPHASEIEVNAWIVNTQYVVPIKKPVCSGEGYQDVVISFTIPTDFNSLGSIVPGFNGCQNVGDCVLQVYAHSVESRTYAIGVPLIVLNYQGGASTSSTAGIQPAGHDVGTDLSKLTHDICLPATDTSADITTSVPRMARYVSDIYNSAYQNNAYSPYSGQQPESISRNMQASCIYRMVTGNRGELGQALLQQNQTVFQFQQRLESTATNLVQQYERITDSIISKIGNAMTSTGTIAQGRQMLANCFRCADVGATSTQRLTTTTYIPSFFIPPNLLPTALSLVPPAYSSLINATTGLLAIYVAVITDLSEQFAIAASMGLNYQTAYIKPSIATAYDVTGFRKIDANGRVDWGLYAAKQAALARAAAAAAAAAVAPVTTTPISSIAAAVISGNNNLPTLPNNASGNVPGLADMNGVMGDSSCDANHVTTKCTSPMLMFTSSGAAGLVPTTNAVVSTSSASQLYTSAHLVVVAMASLCFFVLKQ